MPTQPTYPPVADPEWIAEHLSPLFNRDGHACVRIETPRGYRADQPESAHLWNDSTGTIGIPVNVATVREMVERGSLVEAGRVENDGVSQVRYTLAQRPATQTVYYDAQGKAYVPTGERRAPAAGEWYASIVRPSSALQCPDGDDDEFNDWRIILRPALPHEDPRQVPACMTREGQEREPGISPNEAFFAALREYVEAAHEARVTQAQSASRRVSYEPFTREARTLVKVAAAFTAAVDARVEKAMAEMEAQRRAERVSEGR